MGRRRAAARAAIALAAELVSNCGYSAITKPPMRFSSQVANALSNSSGPLASIGNSSTFSASAAARTTSMYGSFRSYPGELGSEQQQAGSRQRRSDLLEHLQPLGEQFLDEERQSCDISAGMGETGDQSQADEVSPEAMTIGIVDVACRAANTAGPEVTMTSTLSATSSLASAGRRDSSPSAKRSSKRRFFPSI